ncbi:MAG TPA: diaminopimelate dehydrogenase [Negativicutes bacterium]|nr:diaminopimelate dehydrogenase [Negativicutes bacterium]
MQAIGVAIVGYGNIGKYALESVLSEKDMELRGVVRRSGRNEVPAELQGVPVVADVRELGKVDVALLCVPSRSVPEEAAKYLALGIHTVDSFDIHGQPIWDLKKMLAEICREHNTAAVISAGWDPGSDSMIRAVMKLMVPHGITYTNFGPGMSMGHSVVAKGVEGVEDAVSLTIPIGTGLHRRLVYVKLAPGADPKKVEATIKADSYFRDNETHVFPVKDLENVKDMGHGVAIEHRGKAGATHNQLLSYCHHVNNPAVTSQIMVSAARAVTRQKPGCYTLLEMPLADYLNMSAEEMVLHMV